MEFSKNLLRIDAEKTAADLAAVIKRQIHQDLKRSGAVVGISGGIDSSVVAALCAKALGPDKVLGVMLPEKESASESKTLGEKLATQLGIHHMVNNIAAPLEGYGCYKMRNEAIRRVFPEFQDSWPMKITIGSKLLEREGFNYFNLVVETPDGRSLSKRMPQAEYLQVVAASNLKQRTRMSQLYYHAERLNYAVVGTGNKDEHELGFFVKYGDGGADLKPIAHLFKLQVFQLATVLPVPKEIQNRIPTTDTYSAEVPQTEFFFGVDFDILDPVWYGMENNYAPADIAKGLGLTVDQVERVMKDIQQKKRSTNYLRMEPLEIGPVKD
jgi:NAD+ synthase